MDYIDLSALVEKCAPTVAPSTMMRVINVESADRIHAIGYKLIKNGKIYSLKRQPANLEEAIQWADWLQKRGYAFDAGIAQVHSTNFARYNVTTQTIFDPCTNIRVSGSILTEFYVSATRKYGEGQRALFAALSAYNSGNFHTGISTGYVDKIIKTNPYQHRYRQSVHSTQPEIVNQ